MKNTLIQDTSTLKLSAQAEQSHFGQSFNNGMVLAIHASSKNG